MRSRRATRRMTLFGPATMPANAVPVRFPYLGGKFGIEDESFVTGGQFSDLAQQPAAVRPADGIQHLAQLAGEAHPDRTDPSQNHLCLAPDP